STVHALLHHEMPLHEELCRAAGIDLATVEEAPENLAYTRYVLEAGYSGDLLDLLAALAPCVLGYGAIVRRLLAAPHAPDHADWIRTYGGEDYQSLCHDVGALIDGAIARRLGDAPETLPRWRD
ncbi:thiaminase II, partial [Staphylococcus pseudintermedius]